MNTLDFFDALYGACQDGWLTLWTLQDKRTHWFPVDKLDQAAETAQKLSNQSKDVYFGVGLRREQVYREKNGKRYLARGENKDVLFLPGFWIDVDIASGAHKERELPQSADEAMKLVQSFQLPPTIVVHSGHGLHAYWLFNRPIKIESDDERQQAETLAERFQATIRTEAMKQGWKLDNTSDLARVLRVPGTINYKGDPKPVEVIKVEAI